MIQAWCQRIQQNSTCLKFAPVPYPHFEFEQAIPPLGRIVLNRKRRRPLSDVDGGSSESKKKRRLRHSLTTSRLSRPFSSPATYIYDRDRSKSAWAKKPIGSSMMRKAAMVNHFRRRILAAQHEAAVNGIAILPYLSHYRPILQPSPLALFQCAAFDQDENDEEYGSYKEENKVESYDKNSSSDMDEI